MAPGKHLINSIDDAVQESLSGYVLAYPHLTLHANKKVVLAPKWNKNRNKVAIICGGGSGHEPFAAGFVGSGMLTASVSGSIYAAPPPSSILHAIKCATKNNKGGCFVIIPNYTGDCLNFGIAIEKAKSLNINVCQVVVGEDCSIPKSEQGRAGNRGLCGMALLMKIVGSLAESGKELNEISQYAQLVVGNMATYGVGLEACSVPGSGLMFTLPADEIELGLGVHGEAGYKRIKQKSAKEVVQQVLGEIIKSLNLVEGCSVAVLVNNFGALSQLEQGIVTREAIVQLRSKNIIVKRVYPGFLMTSLDGTGIHITVLKLHKDVESTLLACLDDKTDAPCWPGCAYSLPPNEEQNFEETEHNLLEKDFSSFNTSPDTYKLNKREENLLRNCLESASKAIVTREEIINELDSGCGDGDCGSTLKRLAEGILRSIDSLSWAYPYDLFSEFSQIAEELMGGTSGALYSLMFTTAAAIFVDTSKNDNLMQIWARALRAGINGMRKYSKAQLGDKTMLDVLEPVCQTFEKNLKKSSYQELTQQILSSAKQACEETKNMMPKAGRASYVKQQKYLNNVDAGAFGIVTWIEAVAETISKMG